MFASACSPTVEPGPSDAQIKRDVTAALDQAGLPTVAAQVNAGVVTLTGTVPDQASVDRAASVVRAVAGIKDVVNQITVDAGAAPPPPPIAIPESPDELTAAKLRTAFLANSTLAGSQIDVKVLGGVAMLTGKVPSEDARAAALKIATTYPGISSVEDKLEVVEKPVKAVADDDLEQSVQTVLDRSFGTLDLTFSIEKGKVTIRGAVRDRGQILQIGEALRGIDGVRSVDTSLLTVEGGEAGERIGTRAPATP